MKPHLMKEYMKQIQKGFEKYDLKLLSGDEVRRTIAVEKRLGYKLLVKEFDFTEDINNEIKSNVCAPLRIKGDKYMDLPATLGNGYYLGKTIHCLLDGKDLSHRAGFLTGLLTIIGAISNWVSEETDYFHKIEDNKKWAKELLYKDNYDYCHHNEKEIPFNILFFRVMTEMYVKRCKESYKISKRDKIFDEWRNTLIQLYCARMVHLNILKTNNEEVECWLRDKNIFLWPFFLHSFLFPDTDETYFSSSIKDVAINLGICWNTLDDLVDLQIDLNNKVWNNVLFMAHKEGVIFTDVNGNMRDTEEIINELIEKRLIEKVSIDNCKLFVDAFTKMENVVTNKNKINDLYFMFRVILSVVATPLYFLEVR